MDFNHFSRQRMIFPETGGKPYARIMLGNFWYTSNQISRRASVHLLPLSGQWAKLYI